MHSVGAATSSQCGIDKFIVVMMQSCVVEASVGGVPYRFHCGIISFAKNAAKSGLKLKSHKGNVNIIWHT